MIELTVKIQDDVAARLAPIHDYLPILLQKIAWALPSVADSGSLSSDPAPDAAAFPVYAEVLDFLVTSPTPQIILAYKVSEETQTRLLSLLEKNRENTLTAAEEAELDVYEQIEHMMILLKARAHSQLKQENSASAA